MARVKIIFPASYLFPRGRENRAKILNNHESMREKERL